MLAWRPLLDSLQAFEGQVRQGVNHAIKPQRTLGTSVDTATPPIRAEQAKRITTLDGLRAIAAVTVLLYHFCDQAKLSFSDSEVVTFPWGRYGVQLFFMISGFVILMSAASGKQVSDFAFARMARLYPAYWAAIVLSYVVVQTTGLMPSRDVGRLYPLVNLTMLQQMFGMIHYLPVAWTLYVELQFYVLVAILIFGNRVAYLPGVLSVVVLIACVGQAGHLPNWGDVVQWVPLVKHAHLFLFGACVFLCRQKVRWGWLACIGLCFLNALCVSTSYMVTVTGLAGLFWLATRFDIPGLAQRHLVFVGSISYSLYLTHITVGTPILVFAGARQWNWLVALALATLASIGVASLLTFSIEQPANQWLRHWWRRRSEMRAVRFTG